MMRSRTCRGAWGLLTATLTGACLLLAPGLASAADLTVNDDTSGPGPAGANCAAPDQATITGAIAAAAASGDRILVCAGTYTQPQVLINKSLQLIGTPGGLSIIDGGNAVNLPSSGLIRTNDSTNGDVLVQDFVVRNPGQVGTGATTPRMAILPKGDDLGTTQDFNRVTVEGLGAGGRDYGLDADNPNPNVIFRNGSITNTDYNPVLLEQTNGATTIRSSEISQNGTTSTSAIFVMNYTGDNTTNPLRIADNDIDTNGRGGITVQTGLPGGPSAAATRNSVDISNNEISDFSGYAITVLNNEVNANGLGGLISNVGIDGNVITPAAGAATSTGIRVQGLVRNVGIVGNNLSGLTTGGIVINAASAGHAPNEVDVHFNRIDSAAASLTSAATDEVDATHNWWGCNTGPNTTGCGTVTGNVDSDPWLVLGLEASPTTIAAPGGVSALTADVTTDSNGDDVAGRFPATPIDFGTTLGTVQTPVGTSNGVAVSTLTAGDTGGTATVNADLDGESLTTDVTITPPPPAPIADAPPTISLTTQKKVKAGKRALLTATVTDDVGIARVDFYAGTKNVCGMTSGPYECRFRPHRRRGAVTITAIATDTSGLTATALGTTRVVRKKKK